MSEQKTSFQKMGCFLFGVVASVKATAKGHFIGVSTGENVITLFRPAASTIPVPTMLDKIEWSISIGRDGFVSLA